MPGHMAEVCGRLIYTVQGLFLKRQRQDARFGACLVNGDPLVAIVAPSKSAKNGGV